MEGQAVSVDSNPIASWSLVRDNAGRITDKAETAAGINTNYQYTYDSMGRLLTVTKDDALVEEYQYGPNGTRTYEMNALRGISGREFTYSDEDHLLRAKDLFTEAVNTYQYDADGFLTEKSITAKTQREDVAIVTTYDYSSRGELLQVHLPDGRVIEYIHDPLGRRIAKKVNGTITEKYLWQGLTRLLAVYDGTDNLLMRFEYADARMPVAMTRSGSTYYLAYDQVGSLRVVADASGNVIKRIDYDSFGNIISDTNPVFNVPFGFAGGVHDRDTNLVRFGYRDYAPDTARWTAKDPIRFLGGDISLYSYCIYDPINWADPVGLELISAEEGRRIIESGESWIGIPYQYAGKTRSGIDCSNFTHQAYTEAGFPYEYLNTAKFLSTPRFQEVEKPQAGDLVLFHGHIGIYNPNPTKEGYTILSATSSKGIRYGKSTWFSGKPRYFRYDKPEEKIDTKCP